MSEQVNKFAGLQNSVESLRTNGSVPLLFVSSNSIKNRLFEAAHSGKPYALIENKDDIFFSEDSIKQLVETTYGRPLNYSSLMAEGKAISTAEIIKQKIEGQFTVITADSVLLIPNEDGTGYEPFNRDGDMFNQAMLDRITAAGEVIYGGAVSVANETGGAYSIQTYAKYPIGRAPKQLPFSFDELQEIYEESDTARPIEVGFLKPKLNGERERIDFAFTPVKQFRPEKAEEAFDFLSGVEAESLKTLENASDLNRTIAPLIQDAISTHPFNTFKYVLPETNLRDPDSHFREGDGLKQGGDCTFFTDHLIRELDTRTIPLSAHVVSFDSHKYGVAEAHMGVAVEQNNLLALMDGGMSIPHPVIYSRDRAIMPQPYLDGRKQVFIHSDDAGQLSLVQLKKNGADHVLYAALSKNNGYATRDKFLDLVARVEPLTVKARNWALAFEAYDRNGIKKEFFVIDRQGKVTVKIGDTGQQEFQITEHTNELEPLLAYFGVTLVELQKAYENWIKITTV